MPGALPQGPCDNQRPPKVSPQPLLPMIDPPGPSNPLPNRQGFLRVVGAVLSAFVGIRRKSSSEQDRASIKPAHVVVAGIIGALLFIGILVTIVRLIIPR